MAKFKRRSELESEPEQVKPESVSRVVLVRDHALGNGTRKAGFQIATVEDGEFVACPGVADVEIQTVRNNPHLIKILE